jgi:hypothetical protein
MFGWSSLRIIAASFVLYDESDIVGDTRDFFMHFKAQMVWVCLLRHLKTEANEPFPNLPSFRNLVEGLSEDVLMKLLREIFEFSSDLDKFFESIFEFGLPISFYLLYAILEIEKWF